MRQTIIHVKKVRVEKYLQLKIACFYEKIFPHEHDSGISFGALIDKKTCFFRTAIDVKDEEIPLTTINKRNIIYFLIL